MTELYKIINSRQIIVHLNHIVTNLPRMDRENRRQYALDLINKMNQSLESRKMWNSGVTSRGGGHLAGHFKIETDNEHMTQIISDQPPGVLNPLAVDAGIPHGWYQKKNKIWRPRIKGGLEVQKQHPPNRPMMFMRPALLQATADMRKRLDRLMNINNLKGG